MGSLLCVVLDLVLHFREGARLDLGEGAQPDLGRRLQNPPDLLHRGRVAAKYIELVIAGAYPENFFMPSQNIIEMSQFRK